MIRMDGKGNDLDLIDDGFIVPDDYVSESDDDSIEPRDGENEAEFELRRQQKLLDREQKKQRHVFVKRLEERMRMTFKLGKQMRPTIELLGGDGGDDTTVASAAATEYKAISLL